MKVTLASWARWRWMNFVPHCLYCFVSGDQFWLLSSPRWRWQWASGESYKSNSVVYTDLRSFLDALDARCANVFLRTSPRLSHVPHQFWLIQIVRFTDALFFWLDLILSFPNARFRPWGFQRLLYLCWLLPTPPLMDTFLNSVSVTLCTRATEQVNLQTTVSFEMYQAKILSKAPITRILIVEMAPPDLLVLTPMRNLGILCHSCGFLPMAGMWVYLPSTFPLHDVKVLFLNSGLMILDLW